MAKDRRDKTGRPGQVNLAQKAGQAGKSPAGGSAPRKKKKKSTGKRVVTILLVILILVSLAFIIVLGVTVYQSLRSPTKPPVTLSSYATTPTSEKSRVSYFLVGLLGEDEVGTMDSLALVCYDKKGKAVQILQVPAATYLGEDGTFAVKNAGSVYGHPKPLDWCETCRKPVYSPEIKDGKHTVCGTKITQKTGSATENLIHIFTQQYGMPVDNFFLLSRGSLTALVNAVGGVDVSLEADMKVDDIQYKKGVQTLDGDAALQYMTTFSYKNTPDSDADRLVRQRKVYTSLFQRLIAADSAAREKDIFGRLMGGANAIRMKNDTESMRAMLLDPSDGKLEEMTTAQALAGMFGELAKVPLENIQFYVMPGEAAKKGNDTYYSIHKADLAALLQEHFNPYGATITEANLQVTELKNSKKTDTKAQAMSAIKVEQAGTVTTTTAATATTAAP